MDKARGCRLGALALAVGLSSWASQPWAQATVAKPVAPLRPLAAQDLGPGKSGAAYGAAPAGTAQRWELVWLAPRAVEFSRRVELMQGALRAHCDGGQVIEARRAWREALVAWGRFSGVLPPDWAQDPAALWLDDAPANPEALEQAIAAQTANTSANTAADEAGTALPSGVRGFSALEWLLWKPALNKGGKSGKGSAAPASASKPAARASAAAGKSGAKASGKASGKASAKSGKSAGKPTLRKVSASTKGDAASAAARSNQPPACRLALSLADQMRSQADALVNRVAQQIQALPPAAASAPPAAMTSSPNPSSATNPAANPATNGAGSAELLRDWLAGLERLRRNALERPLQSLAPADPTPGARPPRNAPRAELPLALSGSAADDRQSRWSALRALAVQDGSTNPSLAASSLEARLRSQGADDVAGRLHNAVQAADRALLSALSNSPDVLAHAGRALAELQALVQTEVSPLLAP